MNWGRILLCFLVVGMIGCRRKSPLPTVRNKPLNLESIKPDERSKHVLVVCNQSSEDSLELAEYYCKRRNIPAENVVQVDTTISEVVTWDDYKWNIQKVVDDAIKKHNEPIDYIVLMRGMPLRVDDSVGPSVDSLLAGMHLERGKIEYTQMDGIESNLLAQLQNPYFQSDDHFSSKKYNMYLVTRLDGNTVEDVQHMIQRGLKARASTGPFLLDKAANRTSGGYLTMNNELSDCATDLNSLGFQVILDNTEKFVGCNQPVMGYVSWGSNDSKFDKEVYRSIKFQPGAICETFVSTSGRSMMPLPSGQSQIVDLIHSGVTGVKGYVSEPFVSALARPTVLFDRYTRGFNLAESFYAASPLILWKDIVIGDPLVCPYTNRPN